MAHHSRRQIATATVALVALTALARAATMTPTVTTLDNGLKVCVAEDFSSDIVAIQVVIRANADCEPDEKAGIRTVLQHAIRASWDRRIAENEDLSFILDMQDIRGGLSINTDWEYVALGYEGISDTLPQALAFMAKGIFEPQISEDVYRSALDLVQSVASGPQSAPAESTIALFRLAMLDRPARAYPLGTPETIETISSADLKAFHRRFYAPALSAVSVVGPIPARDVQDLVAKHFGSLPPGNSKIPSPPPERPGSDSRVAANPQLAMTAGPRMEIASLVVGVPAPGLGDPDEPISYIIHGLLGGNGSASGRIDKDDELWGTLGLPFPTHAAKRNQFIESLPPPTSLRGHVAIHAYVAPRHVEDLRSALVAQFEDLARTPPTDRELDRAKEYVIGSFVTLFDDASARALLFGRAAALGLTGALAADWTRKVRSVTPKDVKRVAKRHFSRPSVGVEFPEHIQ